MTSIIIVNYQSTAYLFRLLASIERFLDASFEVIVVDNGSDEYERKRLTSVLTGRRRHTVTLMANDTNRGFGAACNQAAKHASGATLIFLNPDTELIDNSLSLVPDYLAKNPEVGIVGGILLDEGRRRLRFTYGKDPSLQNYLLRRVWFNHILPPQAKHGIENDPFESDWVSGALLAMPKELLREVGGFDEAFFLYFEDIDLCRRVRAQGKQVIVHPAVQIVHYGGRSFKNRRLQKRFYYASQTKFFRKHYGIFASLMVRIVRLPLMIFHWFV
ncbi:MAG: glycosyltransferase family 2 protein [Parcubacteria group bacterium]|nr:glycosyltransferase family 2 protein [Parcubacteria group bacterium]